MFAEDVKWNVENLNKLKGAKFLGAEYVDPEEGFPFLVFETNGEQAGRFFLDIQQDPEGNGPGFLNIVEAKRTVVNGKETWSG